MLALTFGLAGLLSSPDVPPVTIATWARVAPADFLATAASELNGTSETATYGPPYNNQNGSTQSLLFAPARPAGVTQPVNAAQDFVIGPLTTLAQHRPGRRRPARRLPGGFGRPAAEVGQRLRDRGGEGEVRERGPVVPAANDGPVPAMMASELTLARSGALDTDLLSQQPFYGTNFTKPLLFIEDGAYFVEPGPGDGPDRQPVGRDERDRQLPGPAVAVAVHALVPGPGMDQLGQHRHDRRST